MKKIVVIFIISLVSITQAFANSFPEVRLTFYLDATQSMLTNNRWNESKKCLIEAINAIEYENGTYVKICVFADAGPKKTEIPESAYELFSVFPFTQADANGKSRLCSFVNSLEKPGQGLPKGFITLTNLDKPLMDFINNQKKDSNTRNVMILITDGRHETPDDFAEHLRIWHDSTSSNTYGFVVGIGGIDELTKQIIDSQKYKGRLRGIEQKSVNLNFKFLSIECPIDTININETKTINLKVSGNTNSALEYVKNINLCFRNNARMTLEAETCNDTAIQVKLCNCNLSKEPTQQELIIDGSIAEQVEKEHLVFLLNSTVSVNCVNDFSRTLNIYHIENGKETEFKQDVRRNLGTIEYYKPCYWLGSKERQVPAEIKLKFHLNEDALEQNVSPELVFTNGEGEPLDNEIIRISKNGNLIESIVISEAEEDDIFTIEFAPKKYKEGLIVGGIKLYNNEGIDSVNGIDVKGREECDLFIWQVKINSHINPRLLLLIWIVIILICLFLLGCYIIWHHREFSLRFPTEGRIVFEPASDGVNIQIAGALYRDIEIVPNAQRDGYGSDTIYTEKLNKYYIKEIIVSSAVNPKAYINPTSWDRIWNGDTIHINCNFTINNIDHIVLKPVGTITMEDISLDVFFNDSTCITKVIPIHLISPEMPDTVSEKIDYTNVKVCGRQPLYPIYRNFLHRSINSFINIFNH